MLMLLAMSACSDSDDDDNGKNVDPDGKVVTLAQTPLTVNSDPTDLSARVSNYVAMRRSGSTRAISNFEMPGDPTDDEMSSATPINYDGEWLYGSGARYVSENYTEDNPVTLYGLSYVTLYVAGHAKIDLTNNAFMAKVYVLKGGSVTLTNGYISTSCEVYCNGTIKFADGITWFGLNYSTWSSECYPPIVAVAGDLDCSNMDVKFNGGTLYVGNAFTCKSLELTNSSKVIAGCGTQIGGTLNINGGSSVELKGHTTVDGTIYLSSGTDELYLASGMVLKGQELQLNNTQVKVQIEGDNYVFLDMDKIVSNTADFDTKLNGKFAIKCPEIYYGSLYTYSDGVWQNGSNINLHFLSDVLFNDEISAKGLTIPTSCKATAETNPTPTPNPDTKKVLETIAEVSADHTHNISSTGIDLANGKIYVSWHERGNGYHGCVEIGQVADDSCRLLQFFETPASSGKLDDKSQYGKDFNHIMVDTKATPNRIYVVGNEFDGGLLGYVDLNANGLVEAASGSSAALSYRRLWGADGNCIIRNGDYLQLATTYGYESYALPSLDRAVRDTMPGRAKYIVKDDSRIVGLHFQSRAYRNTSIQTKLADEDTDVDTATDADAVETIQEVDVTIDEFPTIDYLFEQRKELFSTGLTIAPINGKNVVALDGTDIYLCRGALGLTRIAASGDTTNFVLPFTQGVLPRGYVNGVYVDANYVYVAYGSAGLYVLDKKDFSVVAQHTNVGGKSANFVKVDDKYIYVAYGRSGWHVYKLVDVQ
jgi:hypothetical protein